jgi:iron complex transport system substrate-binding protein
MRIVSLLPSATEIICSLGLEDQLVGVTHECDFPPSVKKLPKVTNTLIPIDASSAEIDRLVREKLGGMNALYTLDYEQLESLRPDLIVTQALCTVCAVSDDDVRAIAEQIDPPPEVISLDPRTVGEVLGDIRALAQAVDAKDAGTDLVRDAADRIDRVKLAVRGAERPRVAAIEWLDPVFVAGHWTPQLIEYAGGEDVLGLAGEPSERRSWEEVAAARPDVVVIMPCGYDAERALVEADDHAEELATVGAQRIVAVDATSWFSRPGPRLVDGLEALAHVLHPERVPEPSPGVFEVEL